MAGEQKYYPIVSEFSIEKGPVSKKLPKMTNALVKAAVTKRLNDIRVATEIKEKELGGLTKEDYKKISTQLIDKITTIGKGYLYWEVDLKSIVLTFGVCDDDYEEFEGLVGNFNKMGKEKDEVSQVDLHWTTTVQTN
jgi:hypothetical protein